MPTLCRDCGNVHSDTRKEAPWRWRCVMVPVEPGYGFVDPTYSPNPPYQLCGRVNTNGECQFYEAARQLETA